MLFAIPVAGGDQVPACHGAGGGGARSPAGGERDQRPPPRVLRPSGRAADPEVACACRLLGAGVRDRETAAIPSRTTGRASGGSLPRTSSGSTTGSTRPKSHDRSSMVGRSGPGRGARPRRNGPSAKSPLAPSTASRSPRTTRDAGAPSINGGFSPRSGTSPATCSSTHPPMTSSTRSSSVIS